MRNLNVLLAEVVKGMPPSSYHRTYEDCIRDDEADDDAEDPTQAREDICQKEEEMVE